MAEPSRASTHIAVSWSDLGRSLTRSAIALALFVLGLFIVRSYYSASYTTRHLLGWLPEQVSGALLAVWLIVGVYGIVSFFQAIFRSRRAPCPGCRASLEGLGSERLFPCAQCGQYLEQEAGLLRLVPDDMVANEAVFTCPLPDGARFPATCAVCLAPETRRLKHEWVVSFAPRTGERVPTRYEKQIEVPYCAEHQGGVTVFEGAGSKQIAFTSYAYMRLFRATAAAPVETPPPRDTQSGG